jgi:hypothetical protein
MLLACLESKLPMIYLIYSASFKNGLNIFMSDLERLSSYFDETD